MDVDANFSIEPVDRGSNWSRALPLLVFGVGLGMALARFAPRLGARPAGEPSGLGDLTRDELYQRAQAAQISGRSGMSKDQLIDALDTARD